MHWFPEETTDSTRPIGLTKVDFKGFLKAAQEGFSVEAHYCETCKKLIVPLD